MTKARLGVARPGVAERGEAQQGKDVYQMTAGGMEDAMRAYLYETAEDREERHRTAVRIGDTVHEGGELAVCAVMWLGAVLVPGLLGVSAALSVPHTVPLLVRIGIGVGAAVAASLLAVAIGVLATAHDDESRED